VIGGKPHGPHKGVATCQTYMRSFKDGDTIVVEPFRAKAFPIIKDLVVDRKAFDRIQHAGGFISVRTGLRAGRELDSCSEGERRPRDGRGAVHRLRRLRGRVQKRESAMLFVARRFRTSACCPKASPSASSASKRW
jgi:succinate dehydrogenase / fumarate reductase iron-sulfur subunit